MTHRLPDDDERRRRAEARVADLDLPAPATEADARRVVHELHVHQLELEMQNDELRAARQQAEEAVRRYAELYDFAPIGYLHVGADGKIVESNLAAARLFGRPRAELARSRLSSYFAEPERPVLARFLGRVLTADETDPAQAVELALLPRLGAEVSFVRVTGGPLAGPAPSALIAVEDVTDRRRAEGALREEARRKDDFLAALSHELRNPLAPIRNGVFLLQRTALQSERAEAAVAVIERQVTHLTRIVDDLLDVTRIARGKVRLHRERVELCGHLHRTVEDHRAAFDGGGVRLERWTPDEPCWIDGDPSRLAQVLGNLLGNALKFTNRGDRVDVRLRRERATAVLTVRDTGVGIDRRVLGRLFEPFTQAPQTLDRTAGGLGLGLAMVKGLVELHGGSVAVASDGPGLGTLFTIRLPLATAPGEASRPRAVASGPPRRVLVVDDNEDAATSLRDVLELSGHEVRVALDGPAGLAAAREFHPDVIVCDIGLPGMDGYAVARQLRGDPELRSAWLVAMSGYAGPDDVQRAHEAGFDRHVAKPPTLEALEAMVAEAPVGAARR